MPYSLDDILSSFQPENHVTLATIEDKQPRLRPMTIMYHKKKFYFATGTDSNKIKQIKSNPKIEFILRLAKNGNNGYIRVECTGEKETDKKLIEDLFNEYEFISKLWKSPEDSRLIMIELVPSMFDYMKPGDWSSTPISPSM